MDKIIFEIYLCFKANLIILFKIEYILTINSLKFCKLAKPLSESCCKVKIVLQSFFL